MRKKKVNKQKGIKKAQLKEFLDIEESDPILIKSPRFSNRSFVLVYGIENNLNNGDKKIRTNGKDMTALEAITETIIDLTFVNQKEAYNNHLDFIKASLLQYTEYNKENGILEKIRDNFSKMKNDVLFLENLLIKKDFTQDTWSGTKDLFTEFYQKNANNQTIKDFITNNYYDLRGNKKTKESKNFLDLGIDIGNLRKKINIPKNLEVEKYPFYLENLIEAMKYRYLIEKDKYDEYIYYMSRIAEIFKEIDTIAPYQWEEKSLITQLLKIYNKDIMSAIKYISRKESKQTDESKDSKKSSKDSKKSSKVKFLSTSVDKFEELIHSEEIKEQRRILDDEELSTLKSYITSVKDLLKKYQDGTDVSSQVQNIKPLELRSNKVGAEISLGRVPAAKDQRYAGAVHLQGGGGNRHKRTRTPKK
jgi:hypothetical protein